MGDLSELELRLMEAMQKGFALFFEGQKALEERLDALEKKLSQPVQILPVQSKPVDTVYRPSRTDGT